MVGSISSPRDVLTWPIIRCVRLVQTCLDSADFSRSGNEMSAGPMNIQPISVLPRTCRTRRLYGETSARMSRRSIRPNAQPAAHPFSIILKNDTLKAPMDAATFVLCFASCSTPAAYPWMLLRAPCLLPCPWI
jgi:hypothetical protein